MAGDGEQRDVRESLGDLERRLLDLERELRTDASEDATVAAGAPAPPKGKSKRAGTGDEEPPDRGGGVAAPPAPPPDIDLFAQDARAKVAALRETLDGLTTATDRLRETAQTVVEDHGRALVRLERATGAPATVVMPATAVAPARTAEPPAPETAEAPSSDSSASAPAEVRDAEATTSEPDDAEPVAQAAAAAPPAAPRLERPELPPLPWRRLLAAAAAIVVLGLAYALFFGGGSDGPKSPAGPTGIAASDAAITAAGGGISALPQLRSGAAADVRADVCAGRIAGAIHVITPGGTGWSCPGLRVVAAPVLVASGFARPGRRGRTCVSVPAAPALDRLRRDQAATARRDTAVRSAPRERAFAAGTAFDRRNRLTLLDGAAAPGRPCVPATQKTLRNGTYPLATRLVLYAKGKAATSQEVGEAASRLRTYFAGTPPLYAIVLK